MDLGLTGKRAFLAGSSGGLGYAIASELAADGCRVVINGRDREKLAAAAAALAEKSGIEVGYAAGDAAERGTAFRLVEEAGQKLGGLDLLLTNTGGPPSGSFESLEQDAWQRAVDLVFLSHVQLIRAALPYLKESEHASVLTLTSYSVKQPIPNLILSNSVRAATVGLTKSLALELGPAGIRFNSLLPGWTKTERVLELMTYRAEQNGTSVEEEIQGITAACPLGRMASPEEIGRAGAFLLSPAASYLTGVMLQVDGGMYRGTL
jgi:3-oxoacyl-[acyl-carrier protein] reductase